MKINIDFSLAVILFVVFLILKLLNVINWSWIWIFAPLWISAIIVTLIWIAIIIVNIETWKR